MDQKDFGTQNCPKMASGDFRISKFSRGGPRPPSIKLLVYFYRIRQNFIGIGFWAQNFIGVGFWPKIL